MIGLWDANYLPTDICSSATNINLVVDGYQDPYPFLYLTSANEIVIDSSHPSLIVKSYTVKVDESIKGATSNTAIMTVLSNSGLAGIQIN